MAHIYLEIVPSLHRLSAQSHEVPFLTHNFRWQHQVKVVTWMNEWLQIGDPMTASSGSIKWLERPTELRETFYLAGHQFIIKGDNSGIATWKKCIGQGMGNRASMFSVHDTLPISWRVYQINFFQPCFLDFYRGFIT